jgi:UPF0042 nucleotide-binding protein
MTPSPPPPAPPRVLIITGFSGAGMSSCLKFLEDMDYEVFDNFPPSLVPALAADTGGRGHPIAIVIDARTRGFSPAVLMDIVERTGARLVFVTADEAELIKRFTETRRRHPLATDRPASAGIRKEQEILGPLREAADLVIDTTGLSMHDLRRVVAGHFEDPRVGHLAVTMMSFGFRHGLPRDADIVMDVRFLSNPHWVPELRPLTGLDRAVGDYVSGDPAFTGFIANFKTMVAPLLPRYAAEGKSYLTLAVGCTGGRHRSVYSVETLKPWLTAQGFPAHIVHRDIAR